jgi:hypothetical protein
MQWYYSQNGTQLGPVSQAELQAKIASGEVSASEMVWKDGMSDWTPASRLPEFAISPPPVSGVTSAPGQPPSPYAPPAYVPQTNRPGYDTKVTNYLWQSICVTVLCCMPFGVPAIIYAAKVDGLQARGDTAGAMAASKTAKMWCWISFGCGLAFILFYVGIMVMAAAAGEF